ncbi:ROK family protein [Microbacterium sp. GXF0217]
MEALRLQVPALSARVSRSVIGATLLRLIACGAAQTRTELVSTTGLARTTVDGALATLFDIGAIRQGGLRGAVGRGRPAELIEIDPTFGVVISLDFGSRTVRVAVADLGQRVHAQVELPSRLSEGPRVSLDAAIAEAERLLEETNLAERYRVTVVNVPGPVDDRRGTLVRPPIMPGWDSYPVVDHVKNVLGGVGLVANDVNARALGEARSSATSGPLLYIKVGYGIGAGLVSATGDLINGADGAAGDIGHLRIFGSDAECPCGRVGCLEAAASLSALARRWSPPGAAQPDSVTHFVDGVRHRDPRAIALVHEASGAIGDVVASLVHFFNPARVLIGGDLAAASDDLLAGVRNAVYSRALSLATRNLTISLAPLGAHAGVAGAIVLGCEAAMAANRIEELIERRSRTNRLSELRSSVHAA